MTYMKAVEAGCDIIDCAMSPLALGTSQPATEVMVETFRGTPIRYRILDQKLLGEISCVTSSPIREEASEDRTVKSKGIRRKYQDSAVSGTWRYASNLVSQLKEAGQEDKYQQVLEEIPRVRKDFGEPPLVTPSSQIVGTQAVLNVLMGERYNVTRGARLHAEPRAFCCDLVGIRGQSGGIRGGQTPRLILCALGCVSTAVRGPRDNRKAHP